MLEFVAFDVAEVDEGAAAEVAVCVVAVGVAALATSVAPPANKPIESVLATRIDFIVIIFSSFFSSSTLDVEMIIEYMA